MNVQFKGYKRKDHKIRRGGTYVPGVGVRLLNSSADPLRYPRVRSAKRFIKLVDGVSCLTILYETFGYSGYGAKRVECVFREEPTLMERYGENLCWK